MTQTKRILDEVFHCVAFESEFFLDLRICCIHSALGSEAVASDEGHLFKEDHVHAVLCGDDGGGQACAARAYHDHVAVLGDLLFYSGSCFIRAGRYVGRRIVA